MSLTVKDLEKMQAAYPDYRMELVNGNVVVMSPSGYESEEVGTEFAALLRNWVRPRKLGRVAGSSAGFRLPNTDLRAPMYHLFGQIDSNVPRKTMQNWFLT